MDFFVGFDLYLLEFISYLLFIIVVCNFIYFYKKEEGVIFI